MARHPPVAVPPPPGAPHIRSMMNPVPRLDASGACPRRGRVVVDAKKVLWFGGHGVVGLSGLWAIQPGALVAGAVLTWLLVLLGHSVGYHRLLMHGNFKTSKPLGRLLILCGALLGAAGPSAIIRVHDERDWAQRAPEAEGGCHPYFSQHNGFWRDMLWQLFCRLELDHPPRQSPDATWGANPFVRHLDQWWRVWALAPAVPLWAAFGWAGVAWGVSARILAINAGHWAVNHLCHHPRLGVRLWEVPANGVQANDLLRAGPVSGALAGLLTAGECWHANHHAFPESANTGLGRWQWDPGYCLLKALERVGLVWDVREARGEGLRGAVVRMGAVGVGVSQRGCRH